MNLLMTAPCLLGLEGLVSDELKQMQAENVFAENARVFFEGGENMLARANLNSRFSERILIVLDRFNAVTFEELFQGVKAINWSDFIGSADTFPVKGFSINSNLHSIPDCQSIIKKAVSWFEETGPVHQIQFSIIKDEVCIMLDTSGVSLHKRGYRPASNDAPIRETLAAAMCSLSKLKHYHTLYDPCCGSGTILIEGALLANNIAPGLNRGFSFERWGIASDSIIKSEKERCKDLEKVDTDFQAIGCDIDSEAVELTLKNAKNAGVEKFISATKKDIKAFSPSSEKGTLVTNPPYGERMLDIKEAEKIYRIMGEKFISKYGWSYGIISPDEEFEKCFGRKADKRRKLYNGNIKCQYYMYFK
jgi:putative N6-adenine-specific DNA methylase